MTEEEVRNALARSNPQYFALDKVEILAENNDATIDGSTISGSVVAPDTAYTIKFTNDYPGTYLTVNKEWIGTVAEGTTVNVQLYQRIGNQENPEPVAGKIGTLSADNGWTYTFEGLPLRDEEENEITYSVQEVAIAGYNSSVKQNSNDSHIWTITNIETTDVKVIKAWNDNNNQDGIRPETLTVTLSNGDTVTLNEENGWTATITGLDKYDANGEEIKYTWTEETISGYAIESTTVSGNTTTFTNKHVPATIDLEVEKIWDDTQNQDGIRPGSIVVHLFANGSEVASKTLTPNDWKDRFTSLPKYANG